MTALTKPVRRVVARPRRNLVVTLWPARDGEPEIEVREARAHTGYRITVARLFTMLAMRASGVTLAKPRRGTK